MKKYYLIALFFPLLWGSCSQNETQIEDIPDIAKSEVKALEPGVGEPIENLDDYGFLDDTSDLWDENATTYSVAVVAETKSDIISVPVQSITSIG
jgi:hypothetical protein